MLLHDIPVCYTLAYLVAVTQAIVLQNLTHTFLRPNIVDIKLGTVLYDESTPPEKRAHKEKSARETTLLETGMRITGFQVRISQYHHYDHYQRYRSCMITRL